MVALGYKWGGAFLSSILGNVMKNLSISSRQRCSAALLGALSMVFHSASTQALDGGTVRVTTSNSWRAFEIISQSDNPSGDGYNYSMPSKFDGAGAWFVDSSTLRIQVNHETGDASISDVDVDLANLQSSISNMINSGSTGGVSFVESARQAYDRWSSNGGTSWAKTSDTSNTSFSRFCSGQAYAPDTFGTDRGFVDHIYITGEEVSGGRLFAIDSSSRDFYQLSGVVGDASGDLGGIGGMSYDAWENAALVDTGETQHVAIMLAPDGGTQDMKLYIGVKGKDVNGNSSSSFLARNGLAYGSWFYFKGFLPGSQGSTNKGTFDSSSSGALSSSKLEDIDTSPSDPTKVILGDQDSGVFTFDLNLVFSGSFNAGSSSFTVTKTSNESGGTNSLDSPDNIDWSAATSLNGTSYPEGIIFINEDNSSGEIWQMEPDGSNQVKIGQTTVGAESTGIFDLSEFVGYKPGTVLISNNQGSPSSMSVLISPAAAYPIAGFNSSADHLEVTFTDTSSDVDGSIVVWDWDFGDGNNSTAQNPVHTYAASGTYTVELAVTDDDTAVDIISDSMTVTANVAPTAAFTHGATDLQDR